LHFFEIYAIIYYKVEEVTALMFNMSAIEDVSKEYVERMNKIFDDKLKKIILYGSYARGDLDELSDIDVMTLVDLTDEEIDKKRKEITQIKCDLDNKYDVFLSTITKDINHFNHWLPQVPFYQNVNNEGIVWYE